MTVDQFATIKSAKPKLQRVKFSADLHTHTHAHTHTHTHTHTGILPVGNHAHTHTGTFKVLYIIDG